MTDDLVKKLRAGELWKAESWNEKGKRYRSVTYLNMFPGTIEEAADRIEELEKQLAASNKQLKELENDIKNLEYKMFGLEGHT